MSDRGGTIRVADYSPAGVSGHGHGPRYGDGATWAVEGTIVREDPAFTQAEKDDAADRIMSCLRAWTTDVEVSWETAAGDEIALYRARPIQAPVVTGELNKNFQIQVKSRDWRVYETTENEESAALVGVDESGLEFTSLGVAVPWDLGAGEQVAEIEIDNDSRQPTPVRITIAGEVTDPLIRCVETGEQTRISYSSVASDVIVIDSTAAVPVTLNGASYYGLYDDTDSTLWELPPGVSTVRMYARDYDPAATVTLAWRRAAY